MCVSVIMKYSQRAFVRMREASVRDFAYNCRHIQRMCLCTHSFDTVEECRFIMNVIYVAFLPVVVFTGLPHPPNEENMAQQFIQDITVLSGNTEI